MYIRSCKKQKKGVLFSFLFLQFCTYVSFFIKNYYDIKVDLHSCSLKTKPDFKMPVFGIL